MNFLLAALVARQCLTLNPQNDNEFDSSLLSAPVLFLCSYWEQWSPDWPRTN